MSGWKGFGPVQKVGIIGALDVQELLGLLVEKSLVTVDDNGRYRLLETVRDYGRAHLFEHGGETAIRDRHLAHFLAFAEEAERQLTGADQQAWLDRLEEEHDNFRSALVWSERGKDGAEAGLRIAGSIWRYWSVRGHLDEGIRWLSSGLACDTVESTDTARAKALNGAGALTSQRGDYSAARMLFHESLSMCKQLGDKRGIARASSNLGNVATEQGDHAAARLLHRESLEMYRELGDQWGVATSLGNLGNAMGELGDIRSARSLYEESLAIRRELGDKWGVAHALGNLGNAAYDQGDLETADRLLDECLAMFNDLGDLSSVAFAQKIMGLVAYERRDYKSARLLMKACLSGFRELGDMRSIAHSLEGMAAIADAEAESKEAARIWGAAEHLREMIGTPRPPNDQTRHSKQIAAARAALDNDQTFDRAWQEGRAMTLEHAIELALKDPVDT